jgi:hypothetical protein
MQPGGANVLQAPFKNGLILQTADPIQQMKIKKCCQQRFAALQATILFNVYTSVATPKPSCSFYVNGIY